MHYGAMILGVINLIFTMHLSHASEVKFTLWSGNCYAFPKKITSFLRGTSAFFGHEVNLVSGIDTSIENRIKGIAQLILKKNPDVVVFQELWKNDNKELMERCLKPTYPYIYWIPMTLREEVQIGKAVGGFFKTLFTEPTKIGKSETYVELNPLKMDSGLFLASKFPLIKTAHITYRDKGGDEVNAHKGALIVLFNDRRGNPVVLALTHLQSWRDLEYVKIRHKQIRQLGTFLSSKEIQNKWGIAVAPGKKLQIQLPQNTPLQDITIGKEIINLWNIQDLTTVIVGDFNDPITYQENAHRLIDRLTCFTETLQSTGVRVSSNDLISALCKKLAIQEYVVINEVADQTRVTQLMNSKNERSFSISNAAELGKKLGTKDSLYAILGRFYEVKEGKPLWNYFNETTDAKGIQLLDPVFVDGQSTISKYEVLRKEILGDQGAKKPYDPQVALSDHAHIMIEISTKK